MEEGELPEGVLSINEAALGTIEDGDRLDAAIVMPMWRRNHASAALVADNVGRRLENFTWRILSSEKIMQSLSGGQMLAHIMAIQEGGNIRTTPRASPRSSRSLEQYYTVAQPRNTTTLPLVSRVTVPPRDDTPAFAPSFASSAEHNEDEDGAPTPTPSSPHAQTIKMTDRTTERRRSNLGRPPPILKNAGSSGSSKSASLKSPVIVATDSGASADRLGSNERGGQTSVTGLQVSLDPTGSPIPPRYVSTRFSEEVAVSIPHAPKSSSGGKTERSSRSLSDGGQKPRKKEHVAGSVGSRKRPIVMRQRSSQITLSGRPSPTSPSLGTQQSPEDDDDDEEGLTMASGIDKGTRPRSPHPRKGKSRIAVESPSDDEEEASDDSAAEETTKENTKENASIPSSASLVEPDFRSKFADRSRPTTTQHRSFTNLSSAAWRSTAAAPTAASYQASGMMFPEREMASGSRRGSGRAAAFHDEIVPLKAPAPAGPNLSPPVVVNDDDVGETGTETPLPRTKSQLTLLLERDKSGGGSRDKGGKGRAADS